MWSFVEAYPQFEQYVGKESIKFFVSSAWITTSTSLNFYLLSTNRSFAGSRIVYATCITHPILSYPILSYPILYYTILYYTILYYTILYYTILYYTILYYTILYMYYTILYCTILWNYAAGTLMTCKHTKSRWNAPLHP
jgi:hypothetical protein